MLENGMLFAFFPFSLFYETKVTRCLQYRWLAMETMTS